MGTTRVYRSVKKIAHTVSNKPRFNFIESTVSRTLFKIWILPDGCMKEGFKYESTYSHPIVQETLCVGVNPNAFENSNSAKEQHIQNIQNRKKISVVRKLRIKYIRRRQRLAHNRIKNEKKLVPSPAISRSYNFIEHVIVNSRGVSTKVWALPPAELHSVMKAEFTDVSLDPHRMIHERIGIGTKHSKSASGDVNVVPSKEQTSSLASCIEEITKHVEFLKQELAKPIHSIHLTQCLKWADLLFSWIPKTGALPHYSQVAGECWSVALSRGHTYYVAANKIDRKELTTELLLNGVPPKHILFSGGLDRFKSAKQFMVTNNYVEDMIVHKRPSDPEGFAGFEILLEKLLARGPVVVGFDIFPQYLGCDGKGIFNPDETECQIASLERLTKHSVVVTGCGVGLVDGELIEFWQTHDSQGPEWGENGFGKLARRKGLILEAVELVVISTAEDHK